MITCAIPKLPFINRQQTIDFYVNQLHFALGFDYGDYFMVSRDGAELHFFSYPTLLPEKSDFMIYLRVDTQIEALYEEFSNANPKIERLGKMEHKPWGQTEFPIIDPNGTLLTFGQAKG